MGLLAQQNIPFLFLTLLKFITRFVDDKLVCAIVCKKCLKQLIEEQLAFSIVEHYWVKFKYQLSNFDSG